MSKWEKRLRQDYHQTSQLFLSRKENTEWMRLEKLLPMSLEAFLNKGDHRSSTILVAVLM
jgi:hypothetical protein